ncbi:DUF6059 family protein [Streptomyces sp. NPDC055103]
MDGVPNRALGHVVRAALGCYRALVAFGSLWLPLPEDQLRRILYGEDEGRAPQTDPTASPTTSATPPDATPGPPAPYSHPAPAPSPHPARARSTARTTPRLPLGPPPGHPERLCVEVPLSDLELGLARQLKGV